VLKRIFNSQTRTVGGATGILAVSYLVSGFLGLLSDRLLAARFGAGIETSIYFAAFRIPDLVYNILISGGILVAFLPLFSEYFAQSQEKAWEMTNHVLNVFLFLLILVSLILFFLTPWLAKFIAPGFSAEAKTTVIMLMRILLLQPILLGLSNIFSGILHYFYKFMVYALVPIVYNLGIIFGIVFLTPHFGIFGVGLGVLIGAFFHLAVQVWPAIRCGFKYNFLFDFKYPAIRKIFLLIVPRTFGIAANQINLIIITAIASTITAGSVAIFNFANALQGFPVSILGVSLATAIFPALSQLWVNGRKQEFLAKISLMIRQTLFLIIPASVLLFLLRAQIVRLVLGTGRFDWDDTRLTAASLGLFAVSIFASTLIPFLIRAFFSFQNTKTPTLVTVIAVTINVGLSFLFVWLLGFPNFFESFMRAVLKIKDIGNITMIGLPLAFSVAAICQVVFLLYSLYKKIGDFGLKEILKSSEKIIIASIIMGAAAFWALRLSAQFVDMATFLGVFWQTAAALLAGSVSYLLIVYLLRSPEMKFVKSLVFRR